MATVPLSPALRMASSKPRWVMCFMNVREVEFWKITGQKTDKGHYGKPRITAVEIDLNEGREVRSQFARKWNYHFRILVLCSSAPEDAR
jgi:hypothetical protein